MIDKVNKNSNPVSSKLDRPEFREQRLYEKWACKKFWYVKTEAVPLLAGNDPEVVQNETSESHALWEQIKSSVKAGNKDILVEYSESEEEWKITPENAYRLAIENKLKVPDALANLMEFILKTVKSQNQAGTERNIYDQVNPYINPAISSDIKYELILGSALSLLVQYPDKCRDKKGRVRADKIIKLMQAHKDELELDFDKDLSPAITRDLLEKWLFRLQ